MPFGLQNAGQSFQRFMDEVLDGLDFCFVYIDDVLIGSKSEEEHVLHVQDVLTRLAEHGIVLNAEKCVLGVPEVQFLGHMVSARGIIPLARKGGRHTCLPAARDSWAADVLPGHGEFLQEVHQGSCRRPQAADGRSMWHQRQGVQAGLVYIYAGSFRDK